MIIIHNFVRKIEAYFWNMMLGDENLSLGAARENLAVVRIFFYLFVFLTVSGNDYFLQWTNVPSAFWKPKGILSFFSQPLSLDFIKFSFHAWRWLGVFCIFGIFYRILAPCWYLLSLIVVTNGHSYGYQGHVYMPVILAGLPLCFSRASDALSLDRLLGKANSHPQVNILEYVVPLRTMKLIFVLTYFAAGIAKLRFGGVEWMTGSTLRNYFIRSSLIFSDTNQIAQKFRVAEFFYQIPLLCNIMAFGAVALELSAPLAFFRKNIANYIVPLIVTLQVVIFLTLFVRFTPYISLIPIWVNWSWLLSYFKRCGLLARE